MAIKTAGRSVTAVYRPASTHMVGDGFPVRNLFPSNDLGQSVSPFLLLDYAGPRYFEPTEEPRGVGEHPHRGFETVTLVYQGVVAHRDSAGHAGTIGPGDVQWMTAGSGVVHEERHEAAFAKRGGTLEAIQLWVNLPRTHKMTAPRYQTLTAPRIPSIDLPEGAGTVRIIAGSYAGVAGPAKTVTSMHVFDLRMAAGGSARLALHQGVNRSMFVLTGAVSIDGTLLEEAELAAIDRSSEAVELTASQDTKVLVLQGDPINEPVAWYGPFVMNTKAELAQAVADYQNGKMGRLS